MTTPDPTSASRDIAERLESSFGAGPQPVPPARHLTAGRQALRRRRGVGVLAATAAVAVVATTTIAALGGNDPATSSGVPAVAQGTDPAATPELTTEVPGSHRSTDVWIEDDALHAGSSVTTSKVIEDPLHTDEPSFALQADVDGKDFFYLLVGDEQVREPAERRSNNVIAPGFEAWVGATPSPDGDLLALVTFGDGETLEPVPGRTIVEQTDEVDLPDNFAGPNDLIAAATVDFAGERWFVLARKSVGGPADYVIFARDGQVRTLAQFLDYSRGQYDAGVGLR